METTVLGLFHQGGWVMWPLLVFSVLTWAVIIERAYVYLTLRPKIKKLGDAIAESVKNGNFDQAQQIVSEQKTELKELFLPVISPAKTREKTERVLERNRVRFMHYLKRNMWVLGTIGSASPFVGLLGTVLGIVRAFHNMHVSGTGGFSAVAAGISEALIATAAGLIVAIIALVTYNIFVTAANQTVSQIKLMIDEMVDGKFERA